MKTYANVEELLIELDLNPRSKIDVLNKAGKTLINNKHFVVTEDGFCHLFDEDGNLDDISKIRWIYAYYLRNDVKRVIIPDSTTNIDQYAFSYTDIIDIVVPRSVTNIENNAFKYCHRLEKILFKDKSLDEVKVMKNYPFGLENKSIISVK